jgi:hypothetical protein
MTKKELRQKIKALNRKIATCQTTAEFTALCGELRLLTIQRDAAKWAKAIWVRLEDELPYDKEDNALVADAVERYIVEHPEKAFLFVGTGIIEEDYFEEDK